MLKRCKAGQVAATFILLVVPLAAEPKPKPKPKKKRKPSPALKSIEDAEGLPRVLLIGDSISIGYTLATRAQLKGKANVHRIPANGGDTRRGLQSMDKWLGEGKWDVIHFNWGLHDLKYAPKESPEKGNKPRVPIEEYEKNMEQLVTRMKKTGATLIFATTTPYPAGVTPIRIPADAVKYNEAAIRVMNKHEVTVNDLHSFALPRLKELQRPKNVHFESEGSKALGKQVAAAIQAALMK